MGQQEQTRNTTKQKRKCTTQAYKRNHMVLPFKGLKMICLAHRVSTIAIFWYLVITNKQMLNALSFRCTQQLNRFADVSRNLRQCMFSGISVAKNPETLNESKTLNVILRKKTRDNHLQSYEISFKFNA